MALTILHDVIASVLSRAGDGFQSSTTALSGDTLTLVDAGLQDSSETSTAYENGHVKIIAGAQSDQVRRVADYERQTGTLTLGRAYAAPVASGMAYQWSSRMSFADLTGCVNWALEQAYFLRTEVLTPSGMSQVTLPSWITTREQLVDVQGRAGAVVDQYAYYPIHHVAVLEDAGTTPGQTQQSLKVTLTAPVFAADGIVVIGVSPYPALTSGSAATSMPLDWLRAGALHQYYDLLVGRASKDDASRYSALAGQWRTTWLGLCAAYQPNPASRIQLSAPFAPVALV